MRISMVQPASPILILIGLGLRLYSRQSITYGSTRPPRLSTFVPTHHASSSSFHSSFHLVLLLRHPSTTVIVLRSWPSWVCHVSDARGGCTVYPVLAFLCAFIPFLLGQVQSFDLLRCRVFATLRAPSSLPVNRLPVIFVSVYVSTVSPLSFYYFITRSP